MPSVDPNIPGLTLTPEWITADEALRFEALIDGAPWQTDLKRRVQHYGYRYDYRARVVTRDMDLGPLPNWLQGIALRVGRAAGFETCPDQIIINEYLPGQGISPHVDCRPCFGPAIASLSLGCAVDMIFQHPQNKAQSVVRLQPRILMSMTGPARQDWTHSIPARKSDLVEGVRVQRARRISLTFRTVCF